MDHAEFNKNVAPGDLVLIWRYGFKAKKCFIIFLGKFFAGVDVTEYYTYFDMEKQKTYTENVMLFHSLYTVEMIACSLS